MNKSVKKKEYKKKQFNYLIVLVVNMYNKYSFKLGFKVGKHLIVQNKNV